MLNYTRFINSDGAEESLDNNQLNGHVTYPRMNVMGVKMLSSFFAFLGIISILVQVSPSQKHDFVVC